MAITFDAATGNKVTSATSNTWSHTVASGKSNQILVVSVDAGASITGVTYGGQSLTSLGSVTYNGATETLSMWYLLAPPTGANNIIATASGTTFIIGTSASYYGVAQSSIFGTLATNSGTGTASSNTVTTTSAQQMVIDLVNNAAASTDTAGASQTLRFQPATSGAATADIVATGSSMSLSWTFSTGAWAELSVAMNPAITRVQSNMIASTGTVTSQAVTLGSGVTNGNLLVASVTSGSNATSVTPPTGWTQASFNQPGGAANCETGVWWAIVGSGGVTAGTTSFTFTFGAAHNVYIGIMEWKSATGWQASPVDGTATGNASGATATSLTTGTTSTTAQGSELWFASLTYSSAPQTESGLTSGFTRDNEVHDTSNNHTAAMFYDAVSATGAAVCALTITTTSNWAGAIATFKTAAAVVTTTHRLICDGYGGVFS